MNTLSNWTWTLALATSLLSAVVTAPAAHAQTLTTLHSFCLKRHCTDGLMPTAGLVQATNGDLYGTTENGGINYTSEDCASDGCGTIFKITLGGTLTRLYSFCSQTNCTDGANPLAGLIQATNGDLYGTAATGGANNNDAAGCPTGCGTIFKITPAGTLTTLYSFCSQPSCADGATPVGGLIQGADGNFYGTTGYGANGYGTAFMITPSGTLTTLYTFCSQTNCGDGAYAFSGLIQGTDGNFYGTTTQGGIHANAVDCPIGCGTVFEITGGGSLTTLYSFCTQTDCADGTLPYTGLIQGTDGNFYGTTSWGGPNIMCVNEGVDYGCGTVFKLTPAGVLTTLYSFCSQVNCTDGKLPNGLIQATNGNFYGTSFEGGLTNTCVSGGVDYGCGTAFMITSSGTLTTLYSFCFQTDCTDGGLPEQSLIQDTNGTFYGAAAQGGTKDGGTVFSFSVGLGPFVEAQSTSGKVGATVKILGTDLTGASSVTFNGTAAKFTVVSSSEIKTAVPRGATTGIVEVATPGGTLMSNVTFTVQP